MSLHVHCTWLQLKPTKWAFYCHVQLSMSHRPLIAHLSLYTRLKPTCDKKIGMGLVYIFNQWALNCRASGPVSNPGAPLIFKMIEILTTIIVVENREPYYVIIFCKYKEVPLSLFSYQMLSSTLTTDEQSSYYMVYGVNRALEWLFQYSANMMVFLVTEHSKIRKIIFFNFLTISPIFLNISVSRTNQMGPLPMKCHILRISVAVPFFTES